MAGKKYKMTFELYDGTKDSVVFEVPYSPNGVPAGGKAGQYLRKKSDADLDVEWADLVIPEQYGLVTYDQTKTITIT